MVIKYLQVAKPIQDNLGLSEGPSQWQQQKAHLLPHPLYFLYVQADAYSKASGMCLKKQCL